MIADRLRYLTVLAPACLLLLVGACGSDDPTPAGGAQGSAGTSSGGPQVVRVEDEVDYYGACGNEVLRLGDETYYPLLPEERDQLIAGHPLPDEGTDLSSLGSSLHAGLRVMAPGPGDDTGTLAVYSDGIARFESDSGNVIWLTTDERTYNWVC